MNTIEDNGGTGIDLRDVDMVNILNNTITDNGPIGIHVDGPNNGSVVLGG